MNIVRRVMNGLAIVFAIYFIVAIGLTYSQSPVPMSGEGGLDFSSLTQRELVAPKIPVSYSARDGSELPLRVYDSKRRDAPLLVLIHGSGWYGAQFDGLARELAGVADVLVPDLRGHGVAPARRGDVDYIGQLEDDLADLIKARVKPGQKVVLGGHSAGGGLVVRFAGGENAGLIDGAVLLAPFLKYDAPTTRPDTGGWAYPLTRRLIGLSMMNAAGIATMNYLPVIQFNFPFEVLDGPLGAAATTTYSYRMNTSYVPRFDYLKDVAALPPFLLIVGAEDEAFVADQYEPLMSSVTDKGRYRVLAGVGHLDLVDRPETAREIAGFLAGFRAAR
jgi:non-heme chloroperoxidase